MTSKQIWEYGKSGQIAFRVDHFRDEAHPPHNVWTIIQSGGILEARQQRRHPTVTGTFGKVGNVEEPIRSPDIDTAADSDSNM